MQPGEIRQLVKETLTNKIIDQMADELLQDLELKKDLSFSERCQLVATYINKIGA